MDDSQDKSRIHTSMHTYTYTLRPKAPIGEEEYTSLLLEPIFQRAYPYVTALH